MPKIEMRIHSDRLYISNYHELPESMKEDIYNEFNYHGFEITYGVDVFYVDYEKSGLWQVLSELTCTYEIEIY